MHTLALILMILGFYASPNCPGAPPPRLQVGEIGEVAPGIDRLHLRALPAIGAGTIRLLYSGNRFTVTTGPSCNSGYHWWRVELEDGPTGWLAEGTEEEYYLAPLEDKRSLCDILSPQHELFAFICGLLESKRRP